MHRRSARLAALVVFVPACAAFSPQAPATAELRQALTFHASFDRDADADFALGDRRIYTATSYRRREDAAPGLLNPDAVLAPGEGRFGGALRFSAKNTKAIYYAGEKNVPYRTRDWSGTVSFWLSLDPDQDLAPGYCDPIQLTDKDYNDAALWVDFTRDDRPRRFRLGVFGDLKVWNPSGIGPDQNPDFTRRLVAVSTPPFARGKWTHVAITYSGLNGGAGGAARLYLDGRLQGASAGIREPFTWDLTRAAIRLGVNYVGLYDDLSLFSRALTDAEIKLLYALERGVASLGR
jgi:hypothetical protein